MGYNGTTTTSPNGEIWTPQQGPNIGSGYISDVIWNGSQFVAIGKKLTCCNYSAIATSPDGETWTQQIPSQAEVILEPLNSIAWNNFNFVAVGDGGTILTSSNGIDWTQRQTRMVWDNYFVSNLNDINWNGSQFVAIGDMGIGILK
ncbi:MAG: hypothetical protein K8R06_11555 [Methanosarcinales archaeon]|nr:hypothetical protein [Methanosarcinales archaeon]